MNECKNKWQNEWLDIGLCKSERGGKKGNSGLKEVQEEILGSSF